MRHQRHLVLLGHLGHGFGDRRAVRAENQIHLVLGDELFVDGDRGWGLRLVVFHEQLDPPAQDAALLVRVLDTELVAAELVLAQGRERSGLRERRADAKGLLRVPRRRQKRRQNAKQRREDERRPPTHGFSTLATAALTL